MIKKGLFSLALIITSSCSEHRGHNIIEYTGDYRYYAGISEFFDCKQQIKLFVAKAGIHNQLKTFYLQLNLKEKEDVFIKIRGYIKEQQQMEGIDPKMVFVPVELISHDINRGCGREYVEVDKSRMVYSLP